MTITALSLGWGVQSFTIAAMAALGDMDCPDLVLHVDTTWEREATYAYAAAMTPWLRDRGVHVTVVRDKKAHIPLLRSSRSDLTYTQIPTFTEGNGRRAQMRRQCTAHWKIYTQDMVIRRWLREHGYPKGTVVHRLLGISLDEWQRARSSADSQFVLTYPLLERRMTRQDCAAYLQRHGLPIPPKSSCVMCPYHHNAAWVEMKREGGGDWQRACDYDDAIRIQTRRDGTVDTPHYVHRARKPLAEAVVLPEDLPYGQQDFLDDDVPCDSGYCFL